MKAKPQFSIEIHALLLAWIDRNCPLQLKLYVILYVDGQCSVYVSIALLFPNLDNFKKCIFLPELLLYTIIWKINWKSLRKTFAFHDLHTGVSQVCEILLRERLWILLSFHKLLDTF